MSTNKTRIYAHDGLSSAPYSLSIVAEFDILQEAMDYAYNCLWVVKTYEGGSSYPLNFYVFGVDRSYALYYLAGSPSEIQVNEINPPGWIA